MLRELAEHVQQHPAQGEWTTPISSHDVVEVERRRRQPRLHARRAVGGQHRFDGVVGRQFEALVGSGRDAQFGSRAATDRLAEPHPFDEGCVLHQPQQRGARCHQVPTGLFVGEALEARLHRDALLVDEHVELLAEGVRERIGIEAGSVGHPSRMPTRESTRKWTGLGLG